MNVTPYLLLKRSRAVALTEALLDALEQWAADWAILPDHAATCSDACDALPAVRAADWRADGTGLFVAWPAHADAWIEQQVFSLEDGAPRSPLATAVVARARQDLQHALANALTGQESGALADGVPAPALWQRGAGSVLATVQLGTLTVRLLAPAAARSLPVSDVVTGAPLVPLRAALAHQQVALTVELCRAELTLGYLATLALGDVLALPMRLDAPLQLRGPLGAPICAAHLGAHDGQRAVELTPQPDGVPAANQPGNRS